MALLAYAVWSAKTYGKHHFELSFFVSLLRYPLIVLVHEALVVYLPYLLIVYCCRGAHGARANSIVALLVGMSGLSVVLALMNSGSLAHATAICDSLGENAPLDCLPKSTVSGLIFGASSYKQLVSWYVEHRNYLFTYLFCLLAAALAYLPIAPKIKSVFGNRLALSLLVLSVLS